MTQGNKLRYLLLLVALFCCCFTHATSADAEVVRTGYSTIVSAGSGKCLDIYASATFVNALAVQSHCTFAQNEQWTVVNAGRGFNNSFKIVEQQTGQCLDVYQGSMNSGGLVIQNTCGSGPTSSGTFCPPVWAT